MTSHVPPHAGSTSLARTRHGLSRESMCRPPATRWHRRRSTRVATRTPIRLVLGATVYGACLEEVAETGATLAVGSGLLLEVGMTIACELPEGMALAEVRSLRPGRVGVAWSDCDVPAEQWLQQAARERVLAVL